MQVNRTEQHIRINASRYIILMVLVLWSYVWNETGRSHRCRTCTDETAGTHSPHLSFHAFATY
jgi:hypothetical protein